MKRLIIFLIRTRLGLKKHEKFQFANQKSKHDMYYFTSTEIKKIEGCQVRNSSVSLNWLLDDECEVINFPGDRS